MKKEVRNNLPLGTKMYKNEHKKIIYIKGNSGIEGLVEGEILSKWCEKNSRGNREREREIFWSTAEYAFEVLKGDLEEG